MSGTYEDTFFEDLINRYDFLGYLPIGNMYPIFYSDVMRTENSDSYCDSFSTEEYSDVFDYRSLCKNAQNVLSYLKQMIDASILDNDTKWCDYLSYFLHDNIQNCESCNNIKQFYAELNNLKMYYSPLSNNCNIINFEIGKDEFIKKKKLYIYGDILHWIKNNYENISFVKQNIYNQFFGECVDIYKEITSTYKCKINDDYKKEFLNFINNFNTTKRHLESNHVNISHEDVKTSYELMCQAQTIENRGRITEELEEREAESGEENGIYGVGIPGGAFARVDEQGEKLKPELDNHANQTDHRVSDIIEEIPNPNTPKPVGTIIGTSLGFVLPLITLYKIDTKILRRNNIIKDIKNNKQDFLLNSSEDREMELGDAMYRVTYSSATN
ncbi:PIR protein [Plasmodium vivax]|uniref:VIR protein n=1 Tax=Plasmodium vivax TaxID=5855 RepID=A0A565A5E6_PLAVI|nr:PIR protein [Plasmodium vivax]